MVEVSVAGGEARRVETRAALLSVVADPVRLTLLERLAECGTQCVCNLQSDPPMPGNLLSYHLRVLREAGLVTAAKRGRWVDYTLAGDALERLHRALPRLDPSGRSRRRAGQGGEVGHERDQPSGC